MKEHPSEAEGFMRHWLPPQGTANNNVLHICILLPLAESTLKKVAEGSRKLSCFFFLIFKLKDLF